MNISFKRLCSLKWRRRRRFQAPKGLYVVLGKTISRGKYQINDISMNGLSFYYVDFGLNSHRPPPTLSVFTKGRLAAVHIPYRTVCDSETGESVHPDYPIKRRSIKFKRLSVWQKEQIKQLIKDYSVKGGSQI